MKSIGRTDIWQENLYSLCQRHLRLNPSQRGISTPGELENKITERSAAVVSVSTLQPSPQIGGIRQWETSWKTEPQLLRLKKYLKDLGYTIVVEQGDATIPFELTGVATEADNVLILQADAARERVARLKKAGLLLPMGDRDGLVLMLCEEIYFIHADSLEPAEPAPVIDDIARHIFTQHLLGLPFLPWVADIVLHDPD
ncbi:MAG: hypothetical protein JJU11_03335 [Candidatus Sumerlaeia bacterium]|nr:hypothetical protein [Candidatus Sumerlaeia bacterium]